MTVHLNVNFPQRRLNWIANAFWEGEDDDLALNVLVGTDVEGQVAAVQFQCVSDQGNELPQDGGEEKHWICLPSRALVTDLAKDALTASIRMNSLLGGHLPGTGEWEDSMTKSAGGGDPKHFQTALGSVKYVTGSWIQIVEGVFDIQVQKAGGGVKKLMRTDNQELGHYTFAPAYQALCLAGAIEKKFPSYQHDYPTTVITAQQKKDITDWLLSDDVALHLYV